MSISKQKVDLFICTRLYNVSQRQTLGLIEGGILQTHSRDFGRSIYMPLFVGVGERLWSYGCVIWLDVTLHFGCTDVSCLG